MIKFILPVAFILCNYFLYAQEVNGVTYVIKENPLNADVIPVVEALSTSDFECFRFETKTRELTFDNGLVISLFSREKLLQNDFPQNKNCFLEDNVVPYNYVLNILNGRIIIKAPYDKNIKRVNDEK